MESLPPPYLDLPFEAERVVEIVPQPRRTPVRVVGPGRRERAYLEKLARLESDLCANEAARVALARSLETAALIERGSTRRLDRLEREVEDGEERRRALEQEEHRLILALGALQRENEILREKLALLAARAPSRALPDRRSFWSRLLGRA